MAITFTSNGLGVGTETSAAALTPLCPAGITAGRILIAHVYWEGTTDGPTNDPPSGWTKLGLSPYVIQTTIARHWIYGRIADGSESSSGIAFGAPAVTTQRGARIYSFSGRTAGTIEELVNGFSHISNASDPQAPTVVTTQAGALACALIGQNDNNTMAAFVSATGGTWAEAVAEFTQALTPGFTLSLQVCTPTADPGTVTGGSDNTANDPVGVIGFQIMASAPQLVTPDIVALTLTPFTPVVTATDAKLVEPGIVALTLTAFTPLVTVSTTVTPGIAALTLTPFVPTVSAGANVVVTPGLAALTLAFLTPVVTVSDHKTVTPGIAALTITPFTPVVTATANQFVTPATLALLTVLYTPTVTVSTPGSAVAIPGCAVLTITLFGPNVIVAGPPPVVLPPIPDIVRDNYTGPAGRVTANRLAPYLHGSVWKKTWRDSQ